jgi:hypothetical protein
MIIFNIKSEVWQKESSPGNKWKNTFISTIAGLLSEIMSMM